MQWALLSLFQLSAISGATPAAAEAQADSHSGGVYEADEWSSLGRGPSLGDAAREVGAVVPREGNATLSAIVQSDDAESAEARRLLTYLSMDWNPPLDTTPAGGGPASLYAGANYTRWTLATDSPVGDGGRLMLVRDDLHPSGAEAGHCPRYMVFDILPPLDGQQVIPPVSTSAVWTGGMMFTKGGNFQFCWSPGGTFGIADGKIVPQENSVYRVFGAQDTCWQGTGCLGRRRFFCHAPHSLYVNYGPLGTQCFMFVQSSNTPLIYTRLTWMVGDICGMEVGKGLKQWNQAWAREVTPLSRIYLGHTRFDMTGGFRHRLCFCPVYDASTDGVCGEPSDFVQQVGFLDGLVLSFLAVEGDARAQVVPMTRFTIRVDCGGGPWCDPDYFARVKLIEKSWDPVYTSTDLMHWDPVTGCPGAVEVPAWYTPLNCVNLTTGQKLSSHCLNSGGNDTSNKYFGLQETRIFSKLDSGQPVAQIFDVCFVHKPLEVDNIDPSTFDPASDDALQNASRVFFKVGQLVVEPLWVRYADEYVVNKKVPLVIAPPDLTRTSNLHSSSVPFRIPNGTHPVGPILKLVQEQSSDIVDNRRCGQLKSLEFLIDGLLCTNHSWCTPRAVKVGEELVLNGESPDYGVTIKRGGVYAVCYCEAWPGEPNSCDNYDHWLLIGKVIVQGPLGNEEWILDVGMIQSFEMEGFGYRDVNTVVILQQGQQCSSIDYAQLETTIQVCPPGVERRCSGLGPEENATHIRDIPGFIWMYNRTNPTAFIEALIPAGDTTLLKFSQVPVLRVGDTLHLDSNIRPLASHWVRQRDLERILRGSDHGFTVLELLDNRMTARIPLSLNPFPPLVITPPMQGRWWRSNKIRIPNIRGTREISRLPVCWANVAGEYFAWAGYLNFDTPGYLEQAQIGISTTAAGATAPVQIVFKTGDNARYLDPRNSMQLRVTFTNTSLMTPAEAGVSARPLSLADMTRSDQIHEASQAVCGRLFVELWSDHELGFPVPRGCYVDLNRYGAEGRVQAFYILFEAMNGLQARTEYTIVMNVKFPQPISDYAALEEPLLEIAALDDIILKPEGVVDIGWANPDKPVVEAARPNSADIRFLKDGKAGVTIRTFVRDENDFEPPVAGVDFVKQTGDSFGLSFLLRGDEFGRIQGSSIIRLYLMPMTAWALNFRSQCSSDCIPQVGHTCGTMTSCSYEATYSKCRDVVPPKSNYWVDTRGRECKWYGFGQRCSLDGDSYTPAHGLTALFSCCVCQGGIRSNHNVVKLQLPGFMDRAFGSEVIHTIRFWGVRPVPRRGFFATRFGAQLTTPADERPHYTITSGRYVLKEPEYGLTHPVITLVDVVPWGNMRQFKADTALNDFYLRVTMPATMFGAPVAGSDRSPASIEITLPAGYECRSALPASPKGEGDDTYPLPILPEDSPTGNGALPASSSAAGGNMSIAAVGFRSGFWEFEDNKCIFHLAPYMVIFDHQRLFINIFAKNPLRPLPRNDYRNFWMINFTSSGNSDVPIGHQRPCEPFSPPYCNDTGEAWYVNPLGTPADSRSYEMLFPEPLQLVSSLGPYFGSTPNITDPYWRNYTRTFAVLGILEDTTMQPSHLHLAARNTLQIWFVPDLGSKRGGLLGIQTPDGFDFGLPCVTRDLPDFYYSTRATPNEGSGTRVWPLLGMGACWPRRPPRWALKGVTIVIAVDGALLSGRTYGLEVEVTNPTYHSALEDTPGEWWFKADISDGEGFGRDGTYSTFAFYPNGTKPWQLYTTSVITPINVIVSEMRPYIWTGLSAVVEVNPIVFGENITGQLRVSAPEGYEWSWDPFFPQGTFVYRGLLGQTAPMPGGVPILPESGRLNIIYWETHDTYVAGQSYAFRTVIKVPPYTPRASSNSWYFEWGFNSSRGGRVAATRAPAAEVRSLRGAKLEASSTLAGDNVTLWFRIETVTAISNSSSLEIQLPPMYHGMVFDHFLDSDGKYCKVLPVQDFGSEPMPHDLRCRRILFPDAGAQVRLELFANMSGIPPGRYIVELNVTNPPVPSANPIADAAPCGYAQCVSFYSNQERFPVIADGTTREWMSASIPRPEAWNMQYDYWASIPALRITTPLLLAEIVNLTLDERNACGRNDRPGARSNLVIAFMLNSYTPAEGDELMIRAPVGWRFDYDCDFYTRPMEVMPLPSVLPRFFPYGSSNTVYTWPEAAAVHGCRGDGHEATVKLSAGLVPRRTYFFRIGVRQNPLLTPVRNTWTLSLGAESSGHMRGFPVWTFQPIAYFEPMLLAWTDKPDPKPVPVAFIFTTTNQLYGQTHGYPLLPTMAFVEPMIRVIMPPLFEVVVNHPDQDIQGGECFAVLEIAGDCRVCGVPFDPNLVRCEREMNRKNVARVRLRGNTTVIAGVTYKLYLTIFNPHIVNSEDNPPRSWIMETFLGEPVPYAVAPYGYQIDYRNVTGYKITGKAELHVEESFERNASAYNSPKIFTMKFPEILQPGDVIEMFLPPEFESSRIILGLVSSIVCIDFRYLPTLWPTNLSTRLDEILVQPPVRPPIPPTHPIWARNSPLMVELPVLLNLSNISNESAPFNSTAQLESSGLPAWAMPAAMLAHNKTAVNLTHKLRTEFLVLRSHCMGTSRNVAFDWQSSGNQLSLYLLNGMYPGNASRDNESMPAMLCLRADWHINASLLDPAVMYRQCLERCSHLGVGDAHSQCLVNCSVSILPQVEEHCIRAPIERPPDAWPEAFRLQSPQEHRPPECSPPDEASLTSGSRNTSVCTCGAADTLIVEVLWRTTTNLAEDMRNWQAVRDRALDLQELDRTPLRAPPHCLGNKVTFEIGPEDIHPEQVLLNFTTFRFAMAYINPRRPPMPHKNYWMLRHYRNGSVESSDVVPSWPVISRIRYVTISLLTEVLKPDDPAEIHFMFVTVRPATRVLIIAEYPEFFDFSGANVSSIPTKLPSSFGRRLLWQGFTFVEIESAQGNRITISMAVANREYVRFRLGNVKLPYMGGQALFTMYTWIHGIPQDQIKRCCPPGYPAANPGVVFRTPHRLGELRGLLQNEFHLAPFIWPIAATLGTRLDEIQLVSFTFKPLKEITRPSGNDPFVIVVRAPVGYTILPGSSGRGGVYDSSAVLLDAMGRAISDMTPIPSYIRSLQPLRAEVLLPDTVTLVRELDYRVSLNVLSPKSHAVRTDRRLWVIEVADTLSIGMGERPAFKDVYDDFHLSAPVNFTVVADRSPPEIVIEAKIILNDIGEFMPNRVDVYAPAGFKFLRRCLKPGQLDGPPLQGIFISCQRVQSLFEGTYLSDAVLMTGNEGLQSSKLPLEFTLLVKTPAETPRVNRWYVEIFQRTGTIGWQLQQDVFTVRPMTAGVYFAAIAGSTVTIFLSVSIRYPLPFGGHIHLAGPRLYQLLCPVTKVLSPPGFLVPDCTSQDPILTGCWGLPHPNDPDAPFGLPLCDPLHELLLTYPRSLQSNATGSSQYAVPANTVLVMALRARVPVETPRPRSENLFRVRVLDESKLAIDGKLNQYTYNVVTEPVVDDFVMWWTRAAPRVTMTMIIGFRFVKPVLRAEEEPSNRLRVIEIEAPEGIRVAMRRPADIKNVKPDSPIPVVEWNWTYEVPRKVWFGLDERRDVRGEFHFAFPVMTSDGLPLNNLWQIRFCADSPFCNRLLLNVPLPGFNFGEDPGQLDPNAAAILIGSPARRGTRIAWLLWGLAVAFSTLTPFLAPWAVCLEGGT